MHINENHGLYISFERAQRHTDHPHNRKIQMPPDITYSTDSDCSYSHRGHSFANLSLVQEVSVWVKVFIFKSIYISKHPFGILKGYPAQAEQGLPEDHVTLCSYYINIYP